jgi:uncharacterized protein YkwD
MAAGPSTAVASQRSTAASAETHTSATASRRKATRSGAGCVIGASRSSRHKRVCPSTPRKQPRKQPIRPRMRVKQRSTKSPRPASDAPTSVAPTAQPSVVQSSAATIATVLATPCQNSELTPEPANLATVRAAVLCLINRERATNGESPLVASPQLEQAAESHTQELIADDYFAHVSPTGETPVDRIRDTGYIPGANVGYVIGENLAWGTYQLATPQAIVSAWIASPGHLANILEAQYQDTGISVTPSVPSSLAAGSPGATYAQEFGVIVH